MSGPRVHPASFVDPAAKLADGVVVGPGAVIGPNVSIGENTTVGSHALLEGWLTIGRDCRIHHGAVLGTVPQDLKYPGGESYLTVGDRTVVREYATLNKGTLGGGGRTTVGSDCMIMAYAHVAHDCILEDRVIMANLASLGGHVLVERGAILSAMVAVHHFGTIGRMAFLSGMAGCRRDAPPFMILEGNPARVRGVNIVGLQRAGVSREAINALRQSCRLLYHSELAQDVAKERIVAEGLDQFAEVKYLLEFLARVEKGNLGRAREALRKQHGPAAAAEAEQPG